MQNAVIFDVDGVLVDSYEVHLKSYQQVAQELDLAMTRQQFAQYFGRTTRETIAEVWPGRRFSADEIEKLDERKEALYRSLLATNFPAMEGAEELIDALDQAGWLLAVGSSGPPQNVAVVLEQLAREERFAARVTGLDVTRGKPDPQVFTIAAQKLGVPPQNCLVIEDAAAGISAASAAEMASVGLVSTGRTRAELASADLVVDSLRQLTVATLQLLIQANIGRYA